MASSGFPPPKKTPPTSGGSSSRARKPPAPPLSSRIGSQHQPPPDSELPELASPDAAKKKGTSPESSGHEPPAVDKAKRGDEKRRTSGQSTGTAEHPLENEGPNPVEKAASFAKGARKKLNTMSSPQRAVTSAGKDKPSGGAGDSAKSAVKSAASKKLAQEVPGLDKAQAAKDIVDNIKGQGEKKTVREEAKDTTKAMLHGAAQGVAAGPKGALVGALKGLGESALKSRRARNMALVAMVPTIFVPLIAMAMVAAIVVSGLMGAFATEHEDFSSSELADSSAVDDENIKDIRDAASKTSIPWQIFAALELSRGEGGGLPSGVADVIEPDGMTCPETGSPVESGLTANALLVFRCGKNQFPDISSWGGVGDRANNPNSDHPNGRAVDIMIPGYDTSEGNARGWEIAEWYQVNSEALGVRYVIFDRKIWTGGTSWEAYIHPSGNTTDPNLNHTNHVHVSVVPDGEAPSTSDGSASGGGSTSSGARAREGSGVYGFVDEATISSDDADDLELATAYLADRLEPLLENHQDHSAGLHLGTGVMLFDTGEMELAITHDEAEEVQGERDDDEDPRGKDIFVDDHWSQQADRVRNAYVQSLADPSSHLAGMDEEAAEEIYQVALDIYMGKPVELTGCRPVASQSSSDDDDDPEDGDSGGSSLPGELTVSGPGYPISLNSNQISHASEIIGAGEQAGVSEQGVKIALMTALQESTLRNLANDGSYSGLSAKDREVVIASLDLPNDGIASDWDSVGLFQQRPSAGWGTVKDLMTPSYSAGKFYESLLKVDGWESMSPAAAAQAVQISAYPDAYAKWEETASEIMANVGGAACGVDLQFSAEGWTNPLPQGRLTSPFMMGRRHPVTGQIVDHTGTDLAAPQGTPILAAQDGVVIKAGGCVSGCMDPDYWVSGYMIALDHGGGVHTSYNHMMEPTKRSVGDVVKAGDVIGYVGSTGQSTGPHLHFQVLTGPKQFVDPVPFMADVGIKIG